MSSPTQVPKPKRANRGKNMAALIEKEGLDEVGRPTKRPNLHRQQKRKRKQPKKTMQEEVEDEDDDEDRDFSDSSSGDCVSRYIYLFPTHLVLDPRISYEGMELDYAGDESLSEHLESSKKNLYEYYEAHYAGKHSASSQVTDPVPGPSAEASAPPHSPPKNFTSRFQEGQGSDP
ncbi:hypothetical protein JB92DRAFT_3145892 [Gautieria morchelliformis]|nr:hypothetical protein JB92DRAFT_3145892 [Gautieria morchelliformis]